MAIYTVKLSDGFKFRMSADMVQAAAGISVNFHIGENDWQPTLYQTADACHSAERAAELVNNYFRAGPDDDSIVESVELSQ